MNTQQKVIKTKVGLLELDHFHMGCIPFRSPGGALYSSPRREPWVQGKHGSKPRRGGQKQPADSRARRAGYTFSKTALVGV